MPSARSPFLRSLTRVAVVATILTGVLGSASATGRESQTPASVSPCPPPLRCTPLAPDRLAWLKGLKAGEPTRDATLAGGFAELLADVVPDATYHLGQDMPFANAVTMVLRGASQPIIIRADRYVMLAACQSPTCSSARAFLWVDTQQGLAIGGLEFNPSNGEPTPSQTLFAKQLLDPITRLDRLPPAFVEDLGQWSKGARLRTPMARYFVNGQGLKTVVPHDEDNCQGGDRSSLTLTLCGSMNLDAAEKDMQAAYYVLLSSFAEGTTMRGALKADQDKWIQDRQTSCGTASDSVTLACRLKSTRDRVQSLIAVYIKPFGKTPH
jgi:uncharacterized protein YecT (DUF1311 family)